jgi:hypothetical protein
MRRWLARTMTIPPLRAASWQASSRMFLGTFVGSLAAVYFFILVIDPYGVVPFSPLLHRLVRNTQPQTFPQILRSGSYNSVVVGTSTSRLLDPAALDRVFGGHFANLAMPSATALNQIRVIDLFRRTVDAPKAVLVGLDHEWCDRNGASVAREKEFPVWAFDDNRWNDFLYLLNNPTLETAYLTLGRLLGRVPEQVVRDDGFDIFVPPDSGYDLARARGHLYRPQQPQNQPLEDSGRRALMAEALQWLDDSLAALPAATRIILVFPPPHAHSLPAPGSPRDAREAECKSKAAAIARRYGALLVDWRIPSPLTMEDSHFWDPVHYRLPIAYRLIDDLDHIVKEGRESPDGSYRILVR